MAPSDVASARRSAIGSFRAADADGPQKVDPSTMGTSVDAVALHDRNPIETGTRRVDVRCRRPDAPVSQLSL